MISLKRFFHWLGVEANARAITVLLAIGAATGALPYFIWDRVLPVYSPTLAANEFGEGYRRGKREAELELTIQQFAAQFKIMEASEAIKNEIESMSDEELKTALRDKLKKGTF